MTSTERARKEAERLVHKYFGLPPFSAGEDGLHEILERKLEPLFAVVEAARRLRNAAQVHTTYCGCLQCQTIQARIGEFDAADAALTRLKSVEAGRE